MNFLVIDDEPLQLKELIAVLQQIQPDAAIFSYAWPDDALEAAKQYPMDVAFLDIQTGGMTGLELAVQLKKVKPDIHIIFVTGYSHYAIEAFFYSCDRLSLKTGFRGCCEAGTHLYLPRSANEEPH